MTGSIILEYLKSTDGFCEILNETTLSIICNNIHVFFNIFFRNITNLLNDFYLKVLRCPYISVTPLKFTFIVLYWLTKLYFYACTYSTSLQRGIDLSQGIQLKLYILTFMCDSFFIFL